MDQTSAEVDQWLRELGPALVLYARQWVPCHADAEDVFHDAFVRFWPQRDRTQDPLAYLYRCVRNAAVDWGRSPQRRQGTLTDADTAMLITRGHDSQADEQRQLLEEAIARLPDDQREVLIMKHYGQLTFESIGQALEIPLRTAQSRHRYALDRLRELLSEIIAP